MPRTIVTPTAKFRPGRCAISGDTQGPFFDTGIIIPRYGRVYISIPHLKLRLDEHGLLDTDQVTKLKAEIAAQSEKIDELQVKADEFKELLRLVDKYMPEREPEVVEKPVYKYRKPSDEEIEDWIKKNGADHPAVVGAKKVEPGSTEEWNMLYRDKKLVPVSVPDPKDTVVEEEPETVSIHRDDKMFEYLGQDIDLDLVLQLNVDEVIKYADGKGEEFEAALVSREYYKSEVEGRKLRKGLLKAFGYWDEEEDSPLVPDYGDDD